MSNLIGIKVIHCKGKGNKEEILDNLLFLDLIDKKQSNLNGFVGWPVFNSISGTFYLLFSKNRHEMNEDILGANDIVDFLPINTRDITWFPASYFKNFDNNQEYIAEIKTEFKQAFIKLIKEMLKLSDSKTIALLFQIQEPARERYFGTVSLKTFLELLDEKKILHNIAYFINE